MSINNGMSCPVCGQGRVQKHFKQEEFTYKGQKKVVDNFPVYVCNCCREKFISAEDSKHFDQELTTFQREVDHLLKPHEIRAIRESLGYNQTEFARMLKVGAKNFARYENGINLQSRYLDWLMRILKDYPEAIKTITLQVHSDPNHNSSAKYPEKEAGTSLSLHEGPT